MRQILLIICFSFLQVFAIGQNKINLNELYNQARQNNSLYGQAELYKQQENLRISNVKKNFMPKLDINAKASYQSDVTTVDIPIPGMELPELPKDQYKISIDVSQLIYDGGLSKVQSQLEALRTKTLSQSTNLELYKLYGQINDIYFRILLLDKNKKSLEINKEEINKSLEFLKLAVDNDISSQDDFDHLKAESIKIDKKLIELEYAHTELLTSLSDITKTEIDFDTELEMPVVNIQSDSIYDRPEYRFLKSQLEQTSLQIDLLNKSRRPKLVGFGQAGYGQPGYNMFYDGFDDFYLIGLRLNWNIYDWGLTKNKKKILNIEQNIIENKKKALDDNIRMGINKLKTELKKIDELKKKDEELIALRESILERTKSKLENGTINSLDYISDLSTLTVARVNLNTYNIMYLQIQMNILFLSGEIENYTGK